MFNCIIYGGSGATGREFVELVSKSSNWSKIFVVTRRMIAEFEPLKEDKRFDFFLTDNILDHKTLKAEHIKGAKVDAVFNFVGSRVKVGEEMFRKTDRLGIVETCNLSKELNARLFSHVSSKGINSKSWFLYMKVKGECVDDLKKIEMPNISVFKPGLLLDRNNDVRWAEKMGRYIPFIDKIRTKDLAAKILKDAENLLLLKSNRGFKIYEHSDIESL